MRRIVNTDRELYTATKIANKIFNRGLKVDDIKYYGSRGYFTLRFNKGKFSILLLEDHSGIDWVGLGCVVCGNVDWYL